MHSTLFDLEHLQKLTYERSRTWSNFFENITEDENIEEIDLNNIEDNYGSEFDENDDELASMEDEECDDVTLNLKNVTNSLMCNNNTAVDLPETANSGEIQLLDVFNQTLPIINEHNRQLKETGLENILSRFDTEEIEEKVGSWLNRHNSLYGGDNTIVEDLKKKEYYRRKLRSSKNCSSISIEVCNDSDDSLQSGETARYIRSSRAGAIKNSASITTMIKTYRMVKSTRDALREKYACEKIEDEYHLKSLRHRRRIANDLEYHHNHYDLARIQKSRKQEMQPMRSSAHKERRKVLRKRNYNNGCSTMDSSSESDYYYEDNPRFHRKYLTPCCKQCHYSASHNNYHLKTSMSTTVKQTHSQRRAIKIPSDRMNRLYYYSHSLRRSLSNSSSSSSFNNSYERCCAVKRNPKFYGDSRPCKRESECQCCNDRKLCVEYKHVADSSTDEWYVDNCSPKKLIKTPPALHAKSSPTLQQLPAATEENISKNLKTTKNNIKTNLDKKSTIQTSTDSALACSEENEATAINNEDEAFNHELQRAIEESKKLYELEQNMKAKSKTEDQKEKDDVIRTNPVSKTRKKSNNKQEEQSEGQKKTSRKRQTSKKGNKMIEENEEIVGKLPKLQEEKQTEREICNKVKEKSPTNNPNEIPEETFFANCQTQAICNSTAVSSKSQAYNRQINEQLKTVEKDGEVNNSGININAKKEKSRTTKSKTTPIGKNMPATTIIKTRAATKKMAATSTTLRSPDLKNTLDSLTTNKTKSKLSETMQDDEDLSDCSLVTSTTGIEPPITASTTLIAKSLEQQQIHEQNSAADSLQKNSQKGIIIYAPDKRSMAPAHSFTNDGYFTITKEHLSSIIGEKPAEKFLKYYIGRKRFNSNSTVYFKPPSGRYLNGSNISSSSDSDDDLESLGQYGDLYESLNKTP